MIKFDNVEFSYGKKQILKNFSLSITKGEHVCLFGESGCGKTTVLRLILGLEKQKNGEITIGKDLKPSVVFQENRLLPFKTVLENVLLFCNNTELALKNLEALGILNAKDLYPNELSGGMKRRVAIARALSADFDYLCLDEPFTGLDAENTKLAAQLILEIAGEKPIILVSHSLEEAEMLSAKIITM